MTHYKGDFIKFLFDELAANIFENFKEEIIDEIIFDINKREEYCDNQVKIKKKTFVIKVD